MKRKHKICPHCKREIEVEFIKEFGDDFRIEKARVEERINTIDEVIKTLAESADTILSDKQYYTLMELKEQK